MRPPGDAGLDPGLSGRRPVPALETAASGTISEPVENIPMMGD
jgi:hypothetical protein